jgi:choline dehydrogenase-like flavoprotein
VSRAARRELRADVCVVGAGAGGAVIAAELAEGGMDVALLEEGPMHDPDSFSASTPRMLASLYRDGGQTVTAGLPSILLPVGRGIGGTTLINSGTCFRTPERILERWQREFGIDVSAESMRPYFERVESALSVSEVTPELAGGNAHVARLGAERLGWSHGYLRRNARGCIGSGVCTLGCPASAKQHTGITYVPRAQRAGARVLPGLRARRVIVERGCARGVFALTPWGEAVHVRAEAVVLAAGTIHTPLLLAHSGLGGRSGQLGRNLSIHPATAIFARMPEIVDMGTGVPQSFYVDEFAAEGFMFEGAAGPPAYAAMALPLTGSAHAEAMADYRRLALFGLMVSDSSRGSVHSLGGRALVRYDLCRDDLMRFRAGLARVRELFEAAGAREVLLPLPQGVSPEDARARDLKLMAFHPLGTARADARPEHGVVDGDLRVHGIGGLYVADGAAAPSSLGVNPQLTIMALATRLAFKLLGTEPGTAALGAVEDAPARA